jgi:hypothetical protein
MRSALVAACVCTALVACGSDDPEQPSASADRAAVRDRVATYLEAYAAGDGARACEQLTPYLRRSADAQARKRRTGSCAQVLSQVGPKIVESVPAEQRQAFVDELTDPKQVTVTIDGDSATAGLGRATRRLELRRVGDRWLIATLGLAQPPGESP